MRFWGNVQNLADGRLEAPRWTSASGWPRSKPAARPQPADRAPITARPASLGRRDDAVGEHADALDLGLDPIALLEELAECCSHTLRRAGGDHVAGKQREALREDRDALV